MQLKKRKIQITLGVVLIALNTLSIALSQEATPTIPLPRIVSATPEGFDSSEATPTPRPDSAVVPLPRIVSATPDLSRSRGRSGMSQADEALLEKAVNASFDNGFAFTINTRLIVETEDEVAIFYVTGNGFITGLEEPGQLQMQALLNVRVEVDGASAAILVEERIVDGIFYAWGKSLEDGRETRWFGYSFASFIEDLIDGFDFLRLPDIGGGRSQDVPEEIEGLANILDLESFITTRRVDSGGSSEAHFTTRVDVERLLDSPETLAAVLHVLRASERFQPDSRNITALTEGFSLARGLIVPDVDWTLDRFVNIETETLTRAEVDFDLELNLPARRRFDMTPVEVTFDAIFVLSGYGEAYTVESPPDALVVDHFEDLETLDLLIPGR